MSLKTHYDQLAVRKRIRAARIAADLTQAVLAEEMCISEEMISRIERGLSMCTPENLMFLCQRFNKTADYFYFGDRTTNDTLNEKSPKEKRFEMNDMIHRLTPGELDKAYRIIKVLALT